jgi:hypothetical protein
MGRHTELTPDVARTIVAAVRNGNYRTTAAALAGVHRSTLYVWEQREDEPYATFTRELQAAEAEAESELLESIRNAMPSIPGEGGRGADPWQSRAWILERRWPKRWASRVRTAVTEEIDAFTDRLQKRLDDETFRKVLDASRESPAGESEPGNDNQRAA